MSLKSADVYLYGGHLDEVPGYFCHGCTLNGGNRHSHEKSLFMWSYVALLHHLLDHRNAKDNVPLWWCHQVLWALERYGDEVHEDDLPVSAFFASHADQQAHARHT